MLPGGGRRGLLLVFLLLVIGVVLIDLTRAAADRADLTVAPFYNGAFDAVLTRATHLFPFSSGSFQRQQLLPLDQIIAVWMKRHRALLLQHARATARYARSGDGQGSTGVDSAFFALRIRAFHVAVGNLFHSYDLLPKEVSGRGYLEFTARGESERARREKPQIRYSSAVLQGYQPFFRRHQMIEVSHWQIGPFHSLSHIHTTCQSTPSLQKRGNDFNRWQGRLLLYHFEQWWSITQAESDARQCARYLVHQP